jgi:exodeoxyribonuclease VIII
LAQPGLTKSALVDIVRRSPAHARYSLDHPRPMTDAMRLGSLAHCAMLEPEALLERYAVGPCDDRRLKEWCEWEAGVPAGLEIVKPREMADAKHMADGVREREAIGALLRQPGEVEVPLLWEEDGEPCKGRPDKLLPALGILLDLKTTSDASPRAFGRQVWTMGYHIGAAHYLAGLRALRPGETYHTAILLAVESDPPHECIAYRLTQDWLDLGAMERSEGMAAWRACRASGVWPGYGDIVRDLTVPRWVEQTREGSGDE